MWQHSLSDCSPHTHGNFAGCDCRPWLGAEATRCSKHGREYLLAWQLFFPASFQFGECGRMQLSPQGPLQLQQMGGIHSSHPPEAGKKKRQYSVLLTVKKKKALKNLPALPKQECWCNTLLWSTRTRWVIWAESAVTRSTCKGVRKARIFYNSWTIAFYSQ